MDEKILIAENADLIKRKRDAAKFLADACNELAASYKQLGLGVFSKDAFIDSVWNNAEKTRRRYVEGVKSTVNESPNAFAAMQEDAVKAAEKFSNPFAQRADRIRKWATIADRELLQYLEFGENGVRLTAEGDAAIIESCRTYLTAPDEIAKYRQHAAIVELLNKLFDNGTSAPLAWWRSFPMRNGRFTMPETPCNYAALIEQAKSKA